MQWQPGYRLKNRPYEIERVLGEGGFGITYKAKHLNFDIPVVIKTPNSKLQRDTNYPKFVESFKREGKQLAKIGLNRHPHIVRVSDFFNEDNLPCIVMDFIEGKNLYDLVLTEGKLTEATAVKYIKQIASALTTCHDAGIIHRDVSPLNIIISDQTGDAILIDFGISMSLQSTRHTHSGNRGFAPWEQMAYWEQNNSKTPQVDIYALAATLYFLVTGQVPTECLARKYNNEKLIEPKQLNFSLSEAINNAILKGMEILPENRPASIHDLFRLLLSRAKRKKKIAVLSKPKLKNSKKIKINYKNKFFKKTIAAAFVVIISIAGILIVINKDKDRSFQTLYAQIAPVDSITLSSDGQLLASAADVENGNIELWNTKNKQRIATFSYDFSRLRSLVLSPNGQLLASGGDKSNRAKRGGYWTYVPYHSLRLWDVSNNSELDSIGIGSQDSVFSVAFSADGKTLASGESNETIKLWDTETKQEIATLKGHSDNNVTSIAFNPDSNLLASASEDSIKLWNVSNKNIIDSIEEYGSHISSVVFSPNGKILAADVGYSPSVVKLWNVETRQEITALNVHKDSVGVDSAYLAGISPDDVTSVAFSPDGNLLAVSSTDKTIKLWDIETKQEIATLKGHSGIVTSITFSPSNFLISGSRDGTIKFWKIPYRYR